MGGHCRDHSALAIDEQLRTVHVVAGPEHATALFGEEDGFTVPGESVQELLSGKELSVVSCESFGSGCFAEGHRRVQHLEVIRIAGARPPRMSLAGPALTTAIIIHAAYNAGATAIAFLPVF